MIRSVMLVGLFGLALGTSTALAAPVECGLTGSLVCSNRPPTARIGSTTIEGRTVTVCDRSTDPEDRAMTRAWTFGDGGSATSECPRHEYAANDGYTITLTVTDDADQSDTATTHVSVQARASEPPPTAQPTATAAPGTKQGTTSGAQPKAGSADGTAETSVLGSPGAGTTVTRTVLVPTPAAQALVQDRHLARIANPPLFIPVRSKGPLLQALAVAASVILVLGFLLIALMRRRVRRKQGEFDQMTSDFLSNLSHELRTPLTPVKGYAEMLGHHRLPKDKARKAADAILHASGRLERVIDTLVGVAEIDAGQTTADRERLDLAAFVAEAVGQWRSREPERTFRCTGSGVFVVADRRLVGIALNQLIDNAVKFSSPDTEVHAEVRADGERVSIAITDLGIGIAQGDQPSIFNDFRQADGSSTREHGGLGLGLALVRRVARMHGGEITVRSATGVGSTFTLSFPATAGGQGRSAA